MNTASRSAIATCVAVVFWMAAASCGGGDSVGPNATRDVSGNWNLTANINSSQLQTTCTLDGVVAITQNGATFTGQVSGSLVVCSGPGGTTSGSADGPVTGGQVNGNTMSYSDGQCTYTGTITGTPANRVQGIVNCNLPLGGTIYSFAGTWEASR